MRCRSLFVALAVWALSLPALAAGVPYPFGGTPSSPLGPVQDPSQLFSYINQLVLSINTNMLANVGGFTIGTPIGSTVPGTTAANGVTISGGLAGGGVNGTAGPTIAATGSDTNINLVLLTKGTGVLVAGNPTMWVPSRTLITCPGFANSGSGSQAFSVNQYVQGYYLWNDWLGRQHAVPAC